jgi:hypothetical protein
MQRESQNKRRDRSNRDRLLEDEACQGETAEVEQEDGTRYDAARGRPERFTDRKSTAGKLPVTPYISTLFATELRT